MMASVTSSASLALVSRPASFARLPARLSPVARNERTRRASLTKASFVDSGYTLADVASKVADKADKVVGSVDAPAWVLPVS